MTPLAVGPFLALVGIVAAFFVLRGKAKTRKSMYRTLRERREVDLRKARERATAAKGSVERIAIEREAAAQAAASDDIPITVPGQTRIAATPYFDAYLGDAPLTVPGQTPIATALYIMALVEFLGAAIGGLVVGDKDFAAG
jgi:hypothetical protein